MSGPGETEETEAIDLVPVPDDSNTALNADEFAAIILDEECMQ